MKRVILMVMLAALTGNVWAGAYANKYPTGMGYNDTGDREYCNVIVGPKARNAMELRLSEKFTQEEAIKKARDLVVQAEDACPGCQDKAIDQLIYLRLVLEAYEAKVPIIKSEAMKTQVVVDFVDTAFRKCYGMAEESNRTAPNSITFYPYNTVSDCHQFAEQMRRYIYARASGIPRAKMQNEARAFYSIDTHENGNKEKVVSIQLNLVNFAYSMGPVGFDELHMIMDGASDAVFDLCLGR